MKIICITGKSGSGKTTFASLLAKRLNCKHIDFDKIGHEALFEPEIKDTLCNKLGTEILDGNSNIDRKKLGNIVFTDKQKMQEFTYLSWGYIEKKLDNILLQNDKFIVLDGNLLPNTKYWDMCNYKILITSNNIQRKNKILERDNISEEYFDKRDSANMDYSPFEFDYIFKNDYLSETMTRAINKLSKQYIEGDK